MARTLLPMKGLKKLHVKGIYRYIFIYTWTLQQLERIGLGDDSLKSRKPLKIKLQKQTNKKAILQGGRVPAGRHVLTCASGTAT